MCDTNSITTQPSRAGGFRNLGARMVLAGTLIASAAPMGRTHAREPRNGVLSVWAATLSTVDTVTAGPQVTTPVTRPARSVDPAAVRTVSQRIIIDRVRWVARTRMGGLYGP